MAVAVEDPDGGVFGSLDVSGLPYRLSPNEELVDLLQDAVDELKSEIA